MRDIRRFRRSVIAAIFLASISLPAASAQEPSPAPDGGAGGDTTAVAVNTKDGSTVFRFTFQIHRAAGDTVDNQNAAVAYASCDGCQTVAISIQTVFVLGDPTIVTPGNYAIAINYECSGCETLASAYQFLLGTGGPVHFTADGNRTIARIRDAIRDLGSGELSIIEIQEALSLLMAEFVQVLETQLVIVGGQVGTAAEEQDEPTGEVPDPTGGDTDGTDGAGTPSPSPSETSPSPTPTSTPSEASPTPSPTP